MKFMFCKKLKKYKNYAKPIVAKNAEKAIFEAATKRLGFILLVKRNRSY